MQNFFCNEKADASKERSKMTSPAEFVRQVKQEISKITWPSKNETFRGTLVVIGASVILAAFLVVVDLVFAKGVGLVIGG